ncbi:hypothetical protein WH47_10088, partial [Habropoda laboriosa]
KQVKKRWTNLRDSYRRAMKKKRGKKSGQATHKIKKWKYEDEMLFLDPYIKERETVTSIRTSDESNNELDTSNTTSTADSNVTQILLSPKNSDVPPEILAGRKIKGETETASTVLMNYILKSKSESPEQQQQEDDIDLFFKSIALTVKKLSPYTQAIAKARVFSIISALELEELSNKNRHHSPSYSSHSSVVPTPITSLSTL